jgi:NAD(P)H-dependent flavin oxidoreductase YrpB (nitropropane dioxygenase family)
MAVTGTGSTRISRRSLMPYSNAKSSLLARVKAWGAKGLSSATTVEEARWLEANGLDAVIAHGLEAGGHRGNLLCLHRGVRRAASSTASFASWARSIPRRPLFRFATTAIAPLRAKAEEQGSGDFSPLWSGQNPSGGREIPAAQLIDELAALL